MAKRSHIGTSAIAKNALRLLRHPWIVSSLVKLEAEKTFFNLVHPHHSQGRAGRIRQVGIRITDLCNLRCHTCGQWGDAGFLRGSDLKTLRQQEVPPSRYLELFIDLIQHGHRPLVYLWGGEPMLYEGILELIQELSALRLPVSIATNGTHLVESAEALVKAPLFLLQVSVDGHSPELHNRIRPGVGNGDNFGKIMEGLDALNLERARHRRGLPILASLTVISRENVHNLVDIYEALRPLVDLSVFYLSWWINPEQALHHEKDFCRRFRRRPETHRGWIGDWKPDDYGTLSHQLSRLIYRSRRLSGPPITIIPRILGIDGLRAYYTDHRARFGYEQCVSIFQVAEINSNGDLSPCRDYHDYVVGNIKESTISELWNSPAYRDFRRSLSTEGLMPVCSRCCGLMGY